MFKKGDINGNKVSMCIGRIAKVLALKAGIPRKMHFAALPENLPWPGVSMWTKQVHSKTRGGRQRKG